MADRGWLPEAEDLPAHGTMAHVRERVERRLVRRFQCPMLLVAWVAVAGVSAGLDAAVGAAWWRPVAVATIAVAWTWACVRVGERKAKRAYTATLREEVMRERAVARERLDGAGRARGHLRPVPPPRGPRG